MQTLESLPIIIDVAWDCLAMPLRELIALEPGAILPVAVPLGHPLTVIAGGQTVGFGNIEQGPSGPAVRISQVAAGL